MIIMHANQDSHSISSDVEVRMFFERTADQEIIVERVQMPKDAPLGQVCDKVLHAWGKSPKIEEIDFLMAQDVEGAVIVSRPDLLKFVESRPEKYL
jgi:hypothetical protein